MQRNYDDYEPQDMTVEAIEAELKKCFEAVGREIPSNFKNMVQAYSDDLDIPLNQISYAFKLARKGNEASTIPSIGKVFKAWKANGPRDNSDNVRQMHEKRLENPSFVLFYPGKDYLALMNPEDRAKQIEKNKTLLEDAERFLGRKAEFNENLND